jgi:hypothetical protein
MKIIFCISDPVDELLKYKADVCIYRNQKIMEFDHFFFTGVYNYPLEYYPHLLINIKWKKKSYETNLSKLIITIHLLYTLPDIIQYIESSDIVYFDEKYLDYLHSIGDECASFEQLLDELHWYNLLN